MGNAEGLHAMQSKKHSVHRSQQPFCHKTQIRASLSPHVSLRLPGTAGTLVPICCVQPEVLRYVLLTLYSLRLAQKRNSLFEQVPAKKALDCSPAVPRKAGTIPPTGQWQQGKLQLQLLCKLQLTAQSAITAPDLGLLLVLAPSIPAVHPKP